MERSAPLTCFVLALVHFSNAQLGTVGGTAEAPAIQRIWGYQGPRSNLGELKQATASSFYYSSSRLNPANNPYIGAANLANDGALSTSWWSDPRRTNAWWIVDLGDPLQQIVNKEAEDYNDRKSLFETRFAPQIDQGNIGHHVTELTVRWYGWFGASAYRVLSSLDLSTWVERANMEGMPRVWNRDDVIPGWTTFEGVGQTRWLKIEMRQRAVCTGEFFCRRRLLAPGPDLPPMNASELRQYILSTPPTRHPLVMRTAQAQGGRQAAAAVASGVNRSRAVPASRSRRRLQPALNEGDGEKVVFGLREVVVTGPLPSAAPKLCGRPSLAVLLAAVLVACRLVGATQ